MIIARPGLTSFSDRLASLTAPDGHEVRLEGVRFESRMQHLRVTIREGITELHLDLPNALAWAKWMTQWAERVAGPGEKA